MYNKHYSHRRFKGVKILSRYALPGIQDKYTAIRLEKACERAMSLHYPSYKVVKNILVSGQDNISTQNGSPSVPQAGKTHRNVRGYDYYAQLAQNMLERQIPLDAPADNKEV